jgi:hypothetical protein
VSNLMPLSLDQQSDLSSFDREVQICSVGNISDLEVLNFAGRRRFK